MFLCRAVGQKKNKTGSLSTRLWEIMMGILYLFIDQTIDRLIKKIPNRLINNEN